ncbi:MAG: 2-C-methyl-D-erythritol 4-phosphate cytidylyltransferase [Desulfobacterales bacterium]
MNCPKSVAIIVAAGSGIRMNSQVPKQYLPLQGRPVLSHTLAIFENCRAISRIYLVIPRKDFDFVRRKILCHCSHKKDITLIEGGNERQDSVFNGLCSLKADEKFVVVHDGVRPLILPETIEACLVGASKYGACIMGLAAKETVKQVDKDHFIQKTLFRDTVWMAQTPQAFGCELLRKAHHQAKTEGYRGTDDASLVEKMGVRIKIISGTLYNIKITTPEDLALAEIVMASSGYEKCGI